MVGKSKRERIAMELADVIMDIKIMAMKKNKKIPSTRAITQQIARELRKEGIQFDQFIPFR